MNAFAKYTNDRSDNTNSKGLSMGLDPCRTILYCPYDIEFGRQESNLGCEHNSVDFG